MDIIMKYFLGLLRCVTLQVYFNAMNFETEVEEQPPNGLMLKSKSSRKSSHRHRSKKSLRRSTAIYVLIDKMIASQAASNERLAALEERRLLLDKELEEKRLEADQRRQEAQREHELRLLSTMAQQMSNVLKVILVSRTRS